MGQAAREASGRSAGRVLARLEGFEPPTFSFEGCRSIHLSYRRAPPVYRNRFIRERCAAQSSAQRYHLPSGGDASKP
jgi:hypothetical protein